MGATMLQQSSVGLNFNVIFAEFHPKVLRYLSGMVGAGVAEDIAQNVFLKVYTGLKNFRGEASLATWIFRIATNSAFDWMRSRSFRAAEHIGLSAEQSGDPAVEDAEPADDASMPSSEVALIRGEMNACIKSYVDALPESYRAALILSDFEELKDQEIAEILGVSVEAVKIRLHRARRELKKRFEAGCEFYRTEDSNLACDQKRPVCSSSS